MQVVFFFVSLVHKQEYSWGSKLQQSGNTGKHRHGRLGNAGKKKHTSNFVCLSKTCDATTICQMFSLAANTL